MGTKTKIEWCDSTINPIMGCTGCELREDHCYAATLCARYAGRKGWPKSFDEPEHFPGRIEKALRWSNLTGKARPDKPWLNGYPRIIFVNDLSDGFCPGADPWQWFNPHIAAMDMSPHIWLLLTKWPDKMLEFFVERCHPIPDNFWLGTSVSQQRDEWRIERLLQIQGAAVRFVSCEPLLSKLNLRQYLTEQKPYSIFEGLPAISWTICGGESGPGARPMHPNWATGIRDQCQAANTPYFFKQHGVWHEGARLDTNRWAVFANNKWTYTPSYNKALSDKKAGYTIMAHIGKKRAGRLLDGREHNELPSMSLSRT